MTPRVSRRQGLIGGAVGLAAAGAGAVLVADRRIERQRREGVAGRAQYASGAARSGYLPTPDGVTLYYEHTGAADAGVTVVLVHGFCLTRDTFLLQRRALRERFGDDVRVIAYDQRSHGRSSRSDRDHTSVDQLGDDLHEVLSTLVPDGPVVLVGHSMGGMTIMALAEDHPEYFGPRGPVRGVMLVSTSPGKLAAVTLGFPAALTTLRRPFVPLLLGGARRGAPIVERGRKKLTDFSWIFVKRLGFGPDVDPALVEFVTDMIGATPVDVIADFYRALMDHDKLEALAALADTPVVVVTGDNDVITPPGHSREIVDALPSARLVRVPDSGHLALLERPETVDGPLAELVSAALRSGQVPA